MVKDSLRVVQASLLEALDYRLWLRESLAFLKQETGLFSLRYVAIKTGLDASTLAKVLAGNLHLHPRYFKPFQELFKLGESHREYWECLVAFNRAKTTRESQRLFADLVRYRNPGARTVGEEQVQYFQHWYHIAIREYLNVKEFKGDFKVLARELIPPIRVEQAREAMQTLLQLGLVEQNDQGVFCSTDTFLSTGGQWQSQAIAHFQQQVMDLGTEAVLRIPQKDRDLSTLTVSLSKACFESVREKMAQTRKEILEMVRCDDESDAVVQLNFQAFPLSQWQGRKQA